MTPTRPERSCDWYHRELHALQNPFNNPAFTTTTDATVTVQIQHCATHRESADALLRLTLHTPDGDVSVDLPTGVCDDLRRRMMSLTMIAEDIDGLDGYHASRYRHHQSCDC